MQTIILNLLTSEQIVIDNPLVDNESVKGACLLDTHCVLYGESQWMLFTMQGTLNEGRREMCEEPGFQILSMDFRSLDEYRIVFWTGELDDKRLVLVSVKHTARTPCLSLHSAMVMNRGRDLLFGCSEQGSNNVTIFKLSEIDCFLFVASVTSLANRRNQ